MALLRSFPHFPKLPESIRQDIWMGLATSPGVSFVSMGDQDLQPTQVHGVAGISDHYSTECAALVVPQPGPENGCLGRYSMWAKHNDIADTGSEGCAAVAKARAKVRDMNIVSVVIPRAPYHLEVPLYPRRYSPLERKPDTFAFVWRPRNATTEEIAGIWGKRCVGHLKTVYLVDMTRPLHLTAQELAGLKVRAGPWYGRKLALVDLDPNPIEDTYELFRGSSAEEIACLSNEIEDIRIAVKWEPGHQANPAMPPAEVRILTPVWLSRAH